MMEMLNDLEEKRLGIEVEETWCWIAICGWYCAVSKRSSGVKVMLDMVGENVMKWRFRFINKKSKTMMVGGSGSGGERKINEKRWRMWKYSSILECGLIEGWEEWEIRGKIGCMSRVNREIRISFRGQGRLPPLNFFVPLEIVLLKFIFIGVD